MRASDISLLVTIFGFCISYMVISQLRPEIVYEREPKLGAPIISQTRVMIMSLIIAITSGLASFLVSKKGEKTKRIKLAMHFGLI